MRYDDVVAALWGMGRGLWGRTGGAELGPENNHSRQGGLRLTAGRASRARGGLCFVNFVHLEKQGRRLSVHPVAQQRRCEPSARSAFLYAARSVPRIALYGPWLSGSVPKR